MKGYGKIALLAGITMLGYAYADNFLYRNNGLPIPGWPLGHYATWEVALVGLLFHAYS